MFFLNILYENNEYINTINEPVKIYIQSKLEYWFC